MEEFLKKIDTFDMILIGLLLVVVFMNFCGKMYNKNMYRNRYRSELLEPSISDLKNEEEPVESNIMPKTQDNLQLITNKIPDDRINPINDMTTGGVFVDDIPDEVDSVGKALVTLSGGDSNPSVVQGVRDATELEFRQAFKMDDISPMPLVIPYQQQVFGQNIVVPPPDPRMDTREPSRMDGGNGSVKVQMVWADWCGYSNKAKEAWPKMQQIVGDSHLGVSINYEDILEKENKELVAQLKVDGFPTFIMTGHIGGKKIHKRFNSIEHKDMATKVKKHISEETQGKPNGFISGQIQNDSEDSDKLVEGYTAYSGQYSTADLSHGASRMPTSDASVVGDTGLYLTTNEDFADPKTIDNMSILN